MALADRHESGVGVGAAAVDDAKLDDNNVAVDEGESKTEVDDTGVSKDELVLDETLNKVLMLALEKVNEGELLPVDDSPLGDEEMNKLLDVDVTIEEIDVKVLLYMMRRLDPSFISAI